MTGPARLASAAAALPARRPGRRPVLPRAVLTVVSMTLTSLLAACGAAAGGHPDYDLQVSTITGLGRVLTDGSGYTLYMYVPDHRGRPTCYHICADRWPPLLLPPGIRHPQAETGISAALLGTVTRTGGSVQVTYNRWPLYLYDADTQPGQATGQADDMGLWYALSPDGAINRRIPPGQAQP
jgi:predicted lipoprotein with Yx(FWY)xxD motif